MPQHKNPWTNLLDPSLVIITTYMLRRFYTFKPKTTSPIHIFTVSRVKLCLKKRPINVCKVLIIYKYMTKCSITFKSKMCYMTCCSFKWSGFLRFSKIEDINL